EGRRRARARTSRRFRRRRAPATASPSGEDKSARHVRASTDAEGSAGGDAECVFSPRRYTMATQTLADRETQATLQTMRAAVVHDLEAPILVEHVPKPVPGEGQALVRIEASGLCHTDIHAAHGDWPVKPSPPFTPGHEGVGIVEALGPGVTEVAIGD